MKIKSTITPFAAGLLALAFLAAPARADEKRVSGSPWHDIRNHRAELGRDRAGLARDRAGLQNFYRNRASHGAIGRKRAEIHQDGRGIKRHRREVRGNYAEPRNAHRFYGHRSNGRFGPRHDGHRTDHGRWGRGWDHRRGYRP